MNNPTPHKPHPYYDRPSKQTSYQIAAISLVLLILLVLIMMVSEVVSDFDNTSIHKKEDNVVETVYKRETIEERKLRWLKSRMMKGSVLRAINE